MANTVSLVINKQTNLLPRVIYQEHAGEKHFFASKDHSCSYLDLEKNAISETLVNPALECYNEGDTLLDKAGPSDAMSCTQPSNANTHYRPYQYHLAVSVRCAHNFVADPEPAQHTGKTTKSNTHALQQVRFLDVNHNLLPPCLLNWSNSLINMDLSCLAPAGRDVLCY